MEMPNLWDQSIREQSRHDALCVDPKVAGNMLVPSFSKGNPDITEEVHELMKKKWEVECEEDSCYLIAIYRSADDTESEAKAVFQY